MGDGDAFRRAALDARIAKLNTTQRRMLIRKLGSHTSHGDRVIRRPASTIQFGMWVDEQLHPGSSVYNNAAALRISGAVDKTALATALAEICRRHEPLRSRYEDDDDGALWAVVDPPADFRLPWRVVDVSGEKAWAAAAKIAEEEAARPFDLSAGPVWRGSLISYADESHLLVLVFHHMISDGQSHRVVFNELRALYQAVVCDVKPDLPDPPRSYFDLIAERERGAGGSHEASLAYWSRQLAGSAGGLELVHEDGQVVPGGSIRLGLPLDVSTRLAAMCASHNTGIFAGFLAAFAVLLHHETGRDDICLTAPVDVRGPAGLPLIGCFVNTVVLRIAVHEANTLSEVLTAAARALAQALDHCHVPFQRVLEAIGGLPGNSARTAFGNITIVHNNAPVDDMRWDGLEVSRHPLPVIHAKHQFLLSVSRTPTGAQGHVEYDKRLPEERVRELIARWAGLTSLISEKPECKVSESFSATAA